MKTLTEFSTLTLRKAAAARAAAGGANAGAPAAELDDAMDASDSAAEGPPGDATAAPPEATPEPAVDAPAEGEAPASDAPVEQKPDPVIDAVAASLGVATDKAARLLEALDIVGNRIDEVRLVRVFQGEKGPYGSIIARRVPLLDRPRGLGQAPRAAR